MNTTYEYHTIAHVALVNQWFILPCKLLIIIFAAKFFPAVSSGGCSLSPKNLAAWPVFLGIATQLAVFIAVMFILLISEFFGFRPTWLLQFFIVTMLSFGISGFVVWLAAKRNRCGNVIFTSLLYFPLALGRFVLYWQRLASLSVAGQLLLNGLVATAMFILGARLAQRFNRPKSPVEEGQNF